MRYVFGYAGMFMAKKKSEREKTREPLGTDVNSAVVAEFWAWIKENDLVGAREAKVALQLIMRMPKTIRSEAKKGHWEGVEQSLSLAENHLRELVAKAATMVEKSKVDPQVPIEKNRGNAAGGR